MSGLSVFILTILGIIALGFIYSLGYYDGLNDKQK